MKIELANKEQAAFIVELLRELYVELGEEKESIQFLKVDLLENILSNQRTEIYLIYNHNNEPIGVTTLTETQAIYAGGKYGVIDEMYIRPGYRSNNIGAQLIQMIKTLATQKNWKRIDVTAPTEERWKRTTDFYQKNGFVFTGPKFKLNLS